jgi:DNA helicase HerA-like ATPase
MSRNLALFADPIPTPLDERAGHILITGASGTGKTQLVGSLCRARLWDPRWGLHVVDPEGELTPICVEYAANPRAGLPARAVHMLRAASPTNAFAIPLLHVAQPAPLLCHQVSVRALAIFQQFLGFGMDEYGPRLSKLFLLGTFGLALAGRPLIDLPDLYARDSAHLRSTIGDAYPYEFMSDELRSLDVLQPRTFLEYRDALVSRLLPIFGNPLLRRVYGPQKPLDIASILRARETVLLDLSGLEHRDAVLIGTSYVSVLFHEALQRAPNIEPHACVVIDEAFDFLTTDLARGFDRLRKRNIQLCLVIQRLGQLA